MSCTPFGGSPTHDLLTIPTDWPRLPAAPCPTLRPTLYYYYITVGGVSHFSETFHVVRLYQCNPLVSQPASRSSYLNGHHFPDISISQKPATIRHRLGNVKTSHSPVPQILYWSQSERLSWSASGPVLRRAYRALELGRPPVRLYVRQASAVRFIPNIKAVTRAHRPI